MKTWETREETSEWNNSECFNIDAVRYFRRPNYMQCIVIKPWHWDALMHSCIFAYPPYISLPVKDLQSIKGFHALRMPWGCCENALRLPWGYQLPRPQGWCSKAIGPCCSARLESPWRTETNWNKQKLLESVPAATTSTAPQSEGSHPRQTVLEDHRSMHLQDIS